MPADESASLRSKSIPRSGRFARRAWSAPSPLDGIINPRMARSQYYGGMIRGISFALHEQSIVDPRSGRPMNANLAEHHVPVNADVPSLEAILIEEHDPHANALGIKGVGEIGITGTAGAVANAVWHATGIRVRKLPITLDRFIGGQ
jgi:xanthine dehydrogenase YagR molybdenum-binding subunit